MRHTARHDFRAAELTVPLSGSGRAAVWAQAVCRPTPPPAASQHATRAGLVCKFSPMTAVGHDIGSRASRRGD